MVVVSKTVYFDVLDDVVGEYNNTCHRTIKMKPIDVKSDSFAEYNKEFNEKDPKLKINDQVRILNTKMCLLKVRNQIGQRKYSKLKVLKILYLGLM